MTLPVRLNGMRNADLGGEIPVKHGHGSHVEVNYPQIPVKHGHGSHVEAGKLPSSSLYKRLVEQ